MAAYVKYKFTRGFILNEENLRNIHDILSKRLTGEDVQISYHIFREDSYSYITKDINDIFKETNNKGYKISDFKIASKENGLEFHLDFSNDGCELKVEGENRDLVFLLSSDIKNHYKNNIATSLISSYKLWKTDFFRIGILILFLTTIFFYFSSTLGAINSFKVDEKVLKDILETDDINSKLNFLITKNNSNNLLEEIPVNIWLMLSLPIVMLLHITGLFKVIMKNVAPTNIYLIGKEKDIQEKMKRIKSNIMWGVVIAFVISVGASLFVWWFTLPKI